MINSDRSISDDLAFLYGEVNAAGIYNRFELILEKYNKHIPQSSAEIIADRVNEQDAILITYADMVLQEGQPPLRSLLQFLNAHLAGVVSAIHILPFFPFSSDDGFSVIDYKTVDPSLGDWADVKKIGEHFRLMFDLVINHISAESAWFQAFLQNDPRYRDYFIVIEPGTDLSAVFRPRELPLLTPVEKYNNSANIDQRLVWTTFSEDQIDLNFSNPEVLLELIDILLFYVSQGAEFIRLDAIAFIWKEIGTDCLHLPKTHRIVQLMRKVLDSVSPRVAIITETNVPHTDNISYFGNGHNEAQLVYNFPLPPLTLHAFHTGSARFLSQWLSDLDLPSETVTFFNFLASHDGIGVTPLAGILEEEEISTLIARIKALGGQVSRKNNPDGTTSPYELNINYLDALADPELEDKDVSFITRRFLAAQAIMLALRGVPGIYFHSLFGSTGWPEGAEESGHPRTINREKVSLQKIERELADQKTVRHHVFQGFQHLLKIRRGIPAFHPHGYQKIFLTHDAVLSFLRASPDGTSKLICLHNVSAGSCEIIVDLEDLGMNEERAFTDLVTSALYQALRGRLALTVSPYQILWLQPGS